MGALAEDKPGSRWGPMPVGCKRPAIGAAGMGLTERSAGQAAAAVVAEVVKAHGSRSSIRLIGWSAMRARTARR